MSMSISLNRLVMLGTLAGVVAVPVAAQTTTRAAATSDTAFDPIREMVSRLSLDQYKATVKGLTKFGDRRQGTERNRQAVDWIEAQLKSYGCTNTERITYDFQPPPPRQPLTPEQLARFRTRAAETGTKRPGPGGSVMRGKIMPTGVNNDSLRQPDLALRKLDTPQRARGNGRAVPA